MIYRLFTEKEDKKFDNYMSLIDYLESNYGYTRMDLFADGKYNLYDSEDKRIGMVEII